MKKSLLMIFVSAAMAASGADTIILKEDFSNPETVKAAWDIGQNKIENGQLIIGKNNKSVELKQKLTGKDNITISLEAALTENSGFGGIKISTPKEHDKVIAYTSQLAHVLSASYIKSPSALRTCCSNNSP